MADSLNYQMQTLPNTTLLDPSIVDRSLATITAGNKEALKTQSALKAAIAEMDLNEAEDGFRQALYDDINKTIEDNSLEGNAYYALDDIITKQGDIASNPALLGRLKAQAAYKQYQNQIDARNDINDDTKAWAKELNPYQYTDKIDENTGEIIGGSEWKPTISPVKDIDLNLLYKTASQYIIPKHNKYETTTFINDDGTLSKTWQPGKTVNVLNEITGEKIEVTREMAENAIQMAIKANPEFEASMRQSYDVAIWKHGKGDKDINIAYDDLGNLKGYPTYRNDLIDPYINQMIRCDEQSSIRWNTSGINTHYKESLKQNGGLGTNVLPLDLFSKAGSNLGAPILLDKSKLYSSVAKINMGKTGIADALGINIDEVPNNYQDLKNLIADKFANNGQDYTELLSKAKNFYDAYGASIANNTDRANSNSELDAATLVEQYINANIPLDQLNGNNPYLQKYKDAYSNLVKGIFGDLSNTTNSAQEIKFVPKNFDKIILSNSEKEDLERLGIRVEDKSFILSRDKQNAIFTFLNLTRGQNGDFYRDNDKVSVNGMLANYMSRKNPDISSQAIFDKDIRTFGLFDQANNFYNLINSVYRDNAMAELEAGNDKVLLGTGTLGMFNVDQVINNAIFGETGKDEYKAIEEHAAKTWINRAKTRNLIDDVVYQAIYDKKSGAYRYIELDRGQKAQIQEEIAAMKDTDIKGNLSFILGNEFKQGIMYDKIKETAKDGNPPTTERVQLIFGNVRDDNKLMAINNSGVIDAAKQLLGNYMNKERMNIGIDGDNYLTIRSNPNESSLTFNNEFLISYGTEDGYFKRANTEQAIGLVNSYRTLIGLREVIKSKENAENIFADYIKANPNIWHPYAEVFGAETDDKGNLIGGEALRLLFNVMFN